MKRLPLLLPLALLAWAPWPQPAAAAGKCVHVIDRPGGKVLVNMCNACRQVGIERRRPSSPAPVHRTYIVPGKAKVPLTLRGTGLTRVTWEEPCPDARLDAQVEAERQEKCITFTQTRDGKPGLLNSCRTCRVAVIEITEADGSRTQKLRRILGSSFEVIDPGNALQGRVADEQPCPK